MNWENRDPLTNRTNHLLAQRRVIIAAKSDR